MSIVQRKILTACEFVYLGRAAIGLDCSLRFLCAVRLGIHDRSRSLDARARVGHCLASPTTPGQPCVRDPGFWRFHSMAG